jgi:hypothetical protein
MVSITNENELFLIFRKSQILLLKIRLGTKRQNTAYQSWMSLLLIGWKYREPIALGDYSRNVYKKKANVIFGMFAIKKMHCRTQRFLLP